MNDLMPVLSPTTQTIVRTGYGLLMLATILWTWWPGRWFFRGARWGGYADESTAAELGHNPFSQRLLSGLWLLSAAMLIMGQNTVVFALINLGICWY